MRILVTGGAGFLGSNLCERLLKDGHDVLAVDNFYTGNRSNIQNLFDYYGFEVIRHDVTTPLIVEVDYIMNLACPASPIQYQKFPVQTARTSILGIINMLDLALKLNVPIFQASTSEVYGDPSVSPQREDYWGNVNPIGIRACYDEGKRIAETLMFDYHRQHDLEIRIARIFNTYGPKMHLQDGRVVSNFIVQALTGKDITIYGDGTQTRSFCFVDDLIEGICLFTSPTTRHTGPINLGNPNEFSILELAKMVITLTNSNSKIIFKELPSDDPKQRKPDIELAEQVLAWKPTVQLENGLTRTILDFERRIDSVPN